MNTATSFFTVDITALSHDEVVHGKGSLLNKMGAWHIPDKAATLRPILAHILQTLADLAPELRG